LERKGGPAGCISPDGTSGACGESTALSRLTGVGISPDGSNVYLTSAGSILHVGKHDQRNTASLAIFDRDPVTGALLQKPGVQGCVSASRAKGCGMATSLATPADLVVSPDGKDIYVSGHHPGTISTFHRARQQPLASASAKLRVTFSCGRGRGAGLGPARPVC
jgi:DNA-binding beta-propeller fold protein YncE